MRQALLFPVEFLIRQQNFNHVMLESDATVFELFLSYFSSRVVLKQKNMREVCVYFTTITKFCVHKSLQPYSELKHKQSFDRLERFN